MTRHPRPSGKPGYIYRLSESEYHGMSDASQGLCLACGQAADGVEPDARRYECGHCGERAVYGLEEAAIIGRVHPE